MKRLALRWGMGLVAMLIIVVLWTPTFGQGKTDNQDVLGALLVEVRGLRASMEQLASAGPRVQLAVARLQLQEQRLNTMLRRLDEVRDRLSGPEGRVTEIQQQLARLQDGRDGPGDPVIRREAEEGLKFELTRFTRQVQQQRAEYSELSAAVAAEQGRWVEINQRLEDLDRTLGRR